jgi:4-diphosphocytidyl-2-C-methyl-D-erythritol kinase
LRIVGRRPDGFHLLESEMVTLDLVDDLEFSEGEVSALDVIDAVSWTVPVGEVAPTRPVPLDGTNLVLRALALGHRTAHVRLTKRIPPGAGLGGGSADAAAALRFAGITDPVTAARLGADVPFCLVGGRAMVRGIGEIVEPLSYVRLGCVLVTPAFGVATPAAYAAFDELGPGPGANDLERAACAVEPRLAQVREVVAAAIGALPTLAGSGSTYFFECPEDAVAEVREKVIDACTAARVVAAVVGCVTTPAIAGSDGRPSDAAAPEEGEGHRTPAI